MHENIKYVADSVSYLVENTYPLITTAMIGGIVGGAAASLVTIPKFIMPLTLACVFPPSAVIAIPVACEYYFNPKAVTHISPEHGAIVGILMSSTGYITLATSKYLYNTLFVDSNTSSEPSSDIINDFPPTDTTDSEKISEAGATIKDFAETPL